MTVFGYFGIRGIVQPIRFLLAYLGVEYTNKIYTTKEEWLSKDKIELNIDFPNIPYLIDGDLKISESSAIPVHLIKKHKRNDLLGQSDDGSYSEKEVRVAQLLGVLKDFTNDLDYLCFSPEFNDIKDKFYTEKLEAAIKRIVNYLGDKEFLVGTLSFADFFLYEILSYTRHIYPQSLTPTLSALIQRFENLPGIKEYIAKPNIDLKAFLLPSMATWFGPQ